MTLGLIKYALIIVFVLIAFRLIRWIVELRFHFQFSRVGFFSITGIRYHHGSGNDKNKQKLSIAVGKIKARPKHPSYTASTAWITIHLSDIDINISNIRALHSGQRKADQRPTTGINRRLSSMGNQLGRIPWWYSLSVVKHILKFTSALPAQFLMAGLANYVDVQVNRLRLSMDDVGVLSIEHLDFSSILFAAMSQNPHVTSAVHAGTEPRFTTSELGTENDHARQRQRHSLKRAEHLFKEKFFVITVQVGHVVFHSIDKPEGILSLPMGSKVAIACHLSAGCVTLKDVEVTIQVDAIHVKLDRLAKYVKSLRSLHPQTETETKHKHASNRSSKLTRLLRYTTISISDTALTSETAAGLYTSIRLHAFTVSAAVQGPRGNADMFVIQGGFDEITWSIFNNKPDLATECIEPLRIPKTRISAAYTMGGVLHDNNKDNHGRSKDDMDSRYHLRNLALQQLNGNIDPAKSTRVAKLTISFQEPKLTVDTDKIRLLTGSFARDGDGSTPSSRPLADASKSDWTQKKKQFVNLPPVLLSIQLERPLVDFCNSSMDHAGHGHGLITCNKIGFDVSGEYTIVTDKAVPAASPPLSPTSEVPVVRKRQVASRAWNKIKLFTKSRQGIRDDQRNSSEAIIAIQWAYNLRLSAKVDEWTLRSGRNVTAATKETPLLTIDKCELGLQVQMGASLSEDNISSTVTWDWEKQHNLIELAIHAPVLNLSTNKDMALKFWMHRVAASFKSTKTREPSANSKPLKVGAARHLKATAEVTGFAVILLSVDQGLKGNREVPVQYMDNTPDKDICSQVTVSLGTVAVDFTGSGLSRQHRSSISSEESAESPLRSTMGNIHASLRRFTIKTRFHTSEGKDVDDLLLWCSRITMGADVAQDGGSVAVSPAVVVKKIGCQYSIEEHYVILLAVYDLIGLKRALGTSTPKEPGTIRKSSKVVLEKIQFQINRTDVALTLPSETHTYLRMDMLRTEFDKRTYDAGIQQPSLKVRNITFFGEAPNRPTKWDQLVELDNVEFQRLRKLDQETGVVKQKYDLHMSKLLFRIPYQFVLANIVDNSVNFVKSLKVMHGRFSGSRPFTYLGPTPTPGPKVLPKIRLKCNAVRFQLDDDPFETDLRLIWRAGVKEQQRRLRLEDAFAAKAQTVMHTPRDNTSRRGFDNEQARSRFLDTINSVKMHKSNSSSTREEETIVDENSADARIKEAYTGLKEMLSSDWIKSIKEARQKEISDHQAAQFSDYRRVFAGSQQSDMYDTQHDDDSDDTTAELFRIETLPIPPHPPLFDFTMMHMTLNVGMPTFPVEDTRLFIHENGKGTPIDAPFSTLIPFHLDWSAGETWAQIRDYPLPMLLVPPPTSCPLDNTHTEVSWALSGDYVLADALGDFDATRRITIPIIKDTYSIDISRTTTPLKFYSIVDIDVHTQDMLSISWSVPYQPAIQEIMRAFDSFTRPPVDPSPKIGFWDKIRLIIHTKAKISFVGGGDLAFLMKGTRDPYDTSERGYGLAKVWSNNVVWLIGYDNPDKEVLQIISQDYAFGVPDLEYGGYTSIYILPGITKALGHGFDEDPTYAPKRTRTLTSLLNAGRSDPRFVKVALKLSDGIRMGIGFYLERMCGPRCAKCTIKSPHSKRSSVNSQNDRTRCRHLTFLPHYQVHYKTPQVVNAMPDHGEFYDAYEGFRSDFIHMSISIIKLSSEKTEKCDIATANMNSMHLSPGFIDHFVTWFRLFGGAMSYPLRSGSLYPRDDPRPTKKFGKHMSSMKYKVMLHPLVIGYFYKDEYSSDNDRNIEETGDSVGLKGVVAAFNVDIHQQREVIDVTNHKLDQKRLKANWPVHEAEIHLKSIDLRAVKACFSGTPSSSSESVAAQTVGAPSIMVSSSSDSTSDSSVDPDLMDGLDRSVNEDNEPSDWVDPDDYVELERTTPTNPPSVQVLPFVYSPLIYYLKQTSRADREKYRYLRETHNCIMGTAGDTRQIQMGFLKRRSQDIDVQIRKHQARLHVVESKLSGTDNERLLEESEAIVEKTGILFEKRNQIQRYLKELETQHMPNVDSGGPQDNAAYSTSTVFGKDSLARWEELMGYFKQRCIVHNPQIIWNNAVRNILYHFLDLQAHRRALSYYGSMRAVKFLRDLTEASHKQQRYKPDTVVVDDSDDGSDTRMTQDLLERLLAEKNTKLVAINETEDPDEAGRAVDSDMPTGANANVNDPDYQKNSIPEGYEMKSSYLVDLLHPQVSLQSDKYPDSLVLMSNERMQVKAFSIIDINDPNAEMDLVKNRTIVSIENSQFFVAKKERFDSVDLLLDNHYGAEQSDRWLAWIPPEMLINYVKGTDQFQRIGHRLAATMQYDKYNQLRFKTHPMTLEQSHLFEDPSDSVHLNFPVLDLTVNSAQYNAMYEVITDLLLYKEPAKKERLDRLREIMMAADRNSLYETTERIASLQDRVRNLVSSYTQYRMQLHHLDQQAVENMRPMREKIREYQEELYLGMEAIKLTQQSNRRKNYHEPKTNLKFVFSAEKIIWSMMIDQDTPLCEWELTNTMYMLINREDRSSSNTIEVEMLHVKNTSPNPVFTDVIAPYYGNTRRAPDFSRNKMLRGYLVNLPPVGGIPVIQHLEINLFPLRLQMTYEFGKAMTSYLFSAERRNKTGSEKPPMTPSSSTAVATENASDGSTFHHSASVTDMRNFLEKNNCDEMEMSSPALLETANGNAELHTHTPAHSSKKGLKPSSKKKRNKKDAVDDLSVMKKRASSNRAFLLVKIPGTRHCLSYRGPKEKNIEDLRDFTFQQPNLEYNNQTWSWFELMSNVKKDFMRAAVLTNSGALIKEKLMIRRHHPKEQRDRFLESNISTQSVSSTMTGDVLGDAMGDSDNESSDSSHEELEDGELEHDAVSLHSLSLYEGELGPADASPPQHGSSSGHGTRRFLHWPLKSRKRQVADPSHDDGSNSRHRNDNRHSIDSLEARGLVETSTALDEELTRKGRMLLGKKYNGPIYSFAAGPHSSKGRRTIKATGADGLNL